MTDDDIEEQQEQIAKEGEEADDGEGFGGEPEADDFGDPGKDGSEPEPEPPAKDDEPEPDAEKDKDKPKPKPEEK